MANQRRFTDEFVVNSYTKICHRTFCQSARLMGQGWTSVFNPDEANKLNAKACTNCEPYTYLAGDTETMILHMGSCGITRTRHFKGQYFRTVREAYAKGYQFRVCRTPPGAKEYIQRLLDEIE